MCYIVTNETHSSQMLHCEAQRWNNTCTKEIEEITSSEAKSLNKSINEIKMVLKTFPEQQWRQEIIQIKGKKPKYMYIFNELFSSWKLYSING